MSSSHGRHQWLDSLARTVVALAVFWLFSFAFLKTARLATSNWRIADAVLLVGCALGLVFAARLRAQLAALLLAGSVATLSSIYLINSYYGMRVFSGRHISWGLILAGVLGALFGAFLMRYFQLPRVPGASQARSSVSGADQRGGQRLAPPTANAQEGSADQLRSVA
jgi:hypothetical protein